MRDTAFPSPMPDRSTLIRPGSLGRIVGYPDKCGPLGSDPPKRDSVPPYVPYAFPGKSFC